tara:strand:- start:14041 stop:15615 length:1575 start_codon:yes stop_codon:yes gene_type:complete
MLSLLLPLALAIAPQISFVDVAGGARLRVFVRASTAALPALLYQPFAFAWPQMGPIGDDHFLPLSDTFALATYDPRGVAGSTGAFEASDRARADDLRRVIEHVARAHKSIYVLAISSAACPTVHALAQSSVHVAGAAFVAPSVHADAIVAPYLAVEVERVWGVSAATFALLPTPLRTTLAMLRTPYARCHDRLLCSGDFYHPLRYVGNPYYARPLTTWAQATKAMLAAVAAGDERAGCDTYGVAVPELRVVVGAHDRGITPVPLIEEWAARVGARFVAVPNASHAVHIERADAVADVVRGLLPPARRGVAPRVAADPPPPSWTRRYEPPVLPFEWQLALGAPVLGFCMFNKVLAPWKSRKAIHVLIGTLLVHSDQNDWRLRASVHAVAWGFLALAAAAALLRAPLARRFAFLHADKRVDPGVACYLLTCSLCASCGVRFVDMAPLFFADPMGAIIGRTVASPKLVGSKSVAGTAAVWLAAFAAWNDVEVGRCAAGATAVAAVELLSADYDNPCIAGLLLARLLA